MYDNSHIIYFQMYNLFVLQIIKGRFNMLQAFGRNMGINLSGFTATLQFS